MGFQFAYANNLTIPDDGSATVVDMELGGPIPDNVPILIVPSLAVRFMDNDTTEIDAQVVVPGFTTFVPSPAALKDSVGGLGGMVPFPNYVIPVGFPTPIEIQMQVIMNGATGPSSGVYASLAVFWPDEFVPRAIA